MKDKVFLHFMILMTFFANGVFAESLVIPDKVYPGQKTIIIATKPSEFESRAFSKDIQVDFGEGITISSITSGSLWTFNPLEIAVVISSTASLGVRNMSLTSLQENKNVVVTNAIEIVDKSEFSVTFDTIGANIPSNVKESWSSIGSADFDDDGDNDIALGGGSSHGNIALFKNSGDGTLDYFKLLRTELASTSSIIFGDFNGDGYLDLAALSPLTNDHETKGYITVFYGMDGGSFEGTKKKFRTGVLPSPMLKWDFDNNGTDDIVVVSHGFRKTKGNLIVFFGRKDKQSFKKKKYKVGKYPRSFALGYINKDNNLDIIYYTQKNRVFTLLGSGGKSFKTKKSSCSNISRGGLITLYDYSGDGELDLLVHEIFVKKEELKQNIIVCRGKGNGKFSRLKKLKGLSFNFIEDVNNDGIKDLVDSSYTVKIKLGNGNFIFSDSLNFSPGSNSNRLISSDMNGDGLLDLVAAGYTSGSLSVLLNTTGK